MKIPFKTSNAKAQSKLNFSDVCPNTFNEEKPFLANENPIKTPILIEKDVFIAKRIEEGDDPKKALEEWLLVEENRKKAEKCGK
jgi:hypothetical protein